MDTVDCHLGRMLLVYHLHHNVINVNTNVDCHLYHIVANSSLSDILSFVFLRRIVANSSLSDIFSFVFLRRNLPLMTLTLCTYDVCL
jgi:hypothetical protein